MAFSLGCNHLWHSFPLKWPCAIAPCSTLFLCSLFGQLTNITQPDGRALVHTLLVVRMYMCVLLWCLWQPTPKIMFVCIPVLVSNVHRYTRMYGPYCVCVMCDAARWEGVTWQYNEHDPALYMYQLQPSLTRLLKITCIHPWVSVCMWLCSLMFS